MPRILSYRDNVWRVSTVAAPPNMLGTTLMFHRASLWTYVSIPYSERDNTPHCVFGIIPASHDLPLIDEMQITTHDEHGKLIDVDISNDAIYTIHPHLIKFAPHHSVLVLRGLCLQPCKMDVLRYIHSQHVVSVVCIHIDGVSQSKILMIASAVTGSGRPSHIVKYTMTNAKISEYIVEFMQYAREHGLDVVVFRTCDSRIMDVNLEYLLPFSGLIDGEGMMVLYSLG